MKTAFTFVLGLAIGALGPDLSAADILYATSLRSNTGDSTFLAGNLYSVDPETAAARLIGPIRVGEAPVGVIAVASHPKTGAFYGITAGMSPTIPRSLVKIDLETAKAEVVASLDATGTDLAFDEEGTLYMWVAERDQLVKVDLESGKTTIVTKLDIEGVVGGGLAIDRHGERALVAVTGATGTLDMVDLRTGKLTRGPAIRGAPYATSIDNLTYSGAGLLYGVNSNGGSPSNAALITIDPKTGIVMKIGTLPDDMRGLIFAPARAMASPMQARGWILTGLGFVALILIVVAMRAGRAKPADGEAVTE